MLSWLIQFLFRDRKRNFVSARTGFAGVILTFVGIFYVYFMYNFEYWTFDSFGSLDSSTKAYLIALYADGLDCIIHPCVLLSGAPSVRKALKKWNIRKIILKPCQRKERTTEWKLKIIFHSQWKNECFYVLNSKLVSYTVSSMKVQALISNANLIRWCS